MTDKTPKILLFDIETAPLSAYMWGIWNQNISYGSQLQEDWHLMSYAAKWLGKRATEVRGLPSFRAAYKNDPTDDKELVKALWKLLDEADIVVTHNGNKFDIKKIQERFLAHKLPPPSPFKSVDTLSAARRHFSFTSNKLDSIATRLGLSNKMTNSGFELWKSCLKGNAKAWREMLAYNKQDVHVLEELYLELRPWIVGHPSLSVYTPSKQTCPTCGGHELKAHDKKYHTDSLTYDLYQCTGCHAFSRSRTNVNSKGAKLPLRSINRR